MPRAIFGRQIVTMVSADFITQRTFTTHGILMSAELVSEHSEEKTKVLVASSATDKPTEMNNGKNKKRRSRIPLFINPLTGRPTTLGLAVVVFGVVFIFYALTRINQTGSSKGGVDERDKNPKFQHILGQGGDPMSQSLNKELAIPPMHRPNIFQAADDENLQDRIQGVPDVQEQPAGRKLDKKKKEPDLPPPPKPKEFPVNTIHKPDLECPEKPYILFLVASSPGGVLARTAVRRTWGDPTGISEATDLRLSWRTVFVMGRIPSKDDQIDRESRSYGDILQGDFEDLVSEETRKVMLGFQWSVKDIPVTCQPKYIFKTNPKVYINLPLIIPWIIDKLKMASDLYVGKILREDHPIRDKLNPLFVPREDFPGSTFPNLARGPLYMISMDVVQRMVGEFNRVTPIAMEDAYVGLLADRVGVSVTDDDHFVLIRKPSNFCHYRNMMFVFDIEPTEVMHVYKIVEEKHRYAECTDRGF